MTKPIENKDLDSARDASIQERGREPRDSNYGIGLLMNLSQVGGLVSPWWSRQRDMELRRFWMSVNHLAGAFYTLRAKLTSVPFRIEARDASVKSHVKLAAQYQQVLEEESEFGQGWAECFGKFLIDRWCLAGVTKIHLGGDRRGKTKAIRKMVAERDPGPVRTADKDGNIVERNVTEWHKTPLGDRKWWWISAKNASGHSKDLRGGIFLTEDHPVLTKQGWLLANAVKPGMFIATGDPSPSEAQSQMLTGSMLGDGCISMVTNRAVLRFGHSVAQEEWLDQKLNCLKGFHWTGRKIRINKPINGYQPKPTIGVNSRASLGLVEWYHDWYPGGKKIVNRDYVERYFSPLMLATWYCDDGSIGHNVTRKNNPTSPQAYLWTNGFSRDDVEWLAEFLTARGIKCSCLKVQKKGKKGYYYIRISCSGLRALAQMIGPFVPPRMRYKLPDNSPEFDQVNWDIAGATSFYDRVVASEQRDYYSGRGVCETTYHLGVEETRSYVAANILVHNTQDNGAFLEIIGDGAKDGPIVGPALGLAHLDSARCQRTGNVEFPVVYTDTDSKRYQLHYTRVIFNSEMTSPQAEMHGVGLCWVSRCIDVAQNMLDIATYKSEKLGSRPQRGIIVTQGGLDPETLSAAFREAGGAMSDQGLSRFSKFVLVGGADYPDAAMQMVDLASLPDGFDEQQSITLGMFAIALAGAVPPRWLWPATASGATKADAMYQHVAGLTGGPGATLAMIASALGGSERGRYHVSGKFLPPSLRMVFDFQDDEQDRTQAEIRELRAKQRTADMVTGVIDVRTAREQAQSSGDISDAQFEALELQEGRVADGSSVLTLFSDPDEQMHELLALGVDDPLDVAANIGFDIRAAIDAQQRLAMAVLATEGKPDIRRKARQAIAALNALAELYDGGGSEAEADQEKPSDMEETEEQDEEQEMTDELEDKSHNAILVDRQCPLCGNDKALSYPDHGGLLVCAKCGRTYNPAVE